MAKTSGWDKARLYGEAITDGTSTFVVATCLGVAGKLLIKNPILKIVWYIGSGSIAALVGASVGKMFVNSVDSVEETVTFIRNEVDKELNASEVV
jgi:hypothetical protein